MKKIKFEMKDVSESKPRKKRIKRLMQMDLFSGKTEHQLQQEKLKKDGYVIHSR